MRAHFIQAQLGLAAAKVRDGEDDSKKSLYSLLPRPSWFQSGSLPNLGGSPGSWGTLLAAAVRQLSSQQHRKSITGRRQSEELEKMKRNERSGSYRNKTSFATKFPGQIWLALNYHPIFFQATD